MLREISATSDIQMIPLMAESEEKLKSLLMKVKDHFHFSLSCIGEGNGNPLQYSCLDMQRFDSLEKTLMVGGIEGRRRRVQQRMRWLDGITDSMIGVWVNSGNW